MSCINGPNSQISLPPGTVDINGNNVLICCDKIAPITTTPAPTTNTSTTSLATTSTTTTTPYPCINNLVIEVKYSNLDGLCPGGRYSNAAEFFVIINNITLGVANLNNGDDGGDRTAKFILSEAQINQISSNSNNGLLNVRIECAIPPNENRGYGLGECDNKLNWIKIYKNNTLEVIYNNCPLSNSFTVNPCINIQTTTVTTTSSVTTSTSTSTTTEAPQPIPENIAIDSAYGDYVWAVLGKNWKMYLTTDRQNWIEWEIPRPSNEDAKLSQGLEPTSITYGNGKFVITAGNGAPSNYIYVFDINLFSFSVKSVPSSRYVKAHFHNSNIWIAIFTHKTTNQQLYTNEFITSTNNFSSYTLRTFPFEGAWSSIVGGNQKIVAHANLTGTIYSLDGINWTQSAESAVNPTVLYGNNLFYSVGQSSILESTDGNYWTSKGYEVYYIISDGSYSSNRSVYLLALNGQKNATNLKLNLVLKSNDNLNSLTEINIPYSDNWKSISTNDDNLFLLVGSKYIYFHDLDAVTTTTPSVTTTTSATTTTSEPTYLLDGVCGQEYSTNDNPNWLNFNCLEVRTIYLGPQAGTVKLNFTVTQNTLNILIFFGDRYETRYIGWGEDVEVLARKFETDPEYVTIYITNQYPYGIDDSPVTTTTPDPEATTTPLPTSTTTVATSTTTVATSTTIATTTVPYDWGSCLEGDFFYAYKVDCDITPNPTTTTVETTTLPPTTTETTTLPPTTTPTTTTTPIIIPTLNGNCGVTYTEVDDYDFVDHNCIHKRSIDYGVNIEENSSDFIFNSLNGISFTGYINYNSQTYELLPTSTSRSLTFTKNANARYATLNLFVENQEDCSALAYYDYRFTCDSIFTTTTTVATTTAATTTTLPPEILVGECNRAWFEYEDANWALGNTCYHERYVNINYPGEFTFSYTVDNNDDTLIFDLYDNDGTSLIYTSGPRSFGTSITVDGINSLGSSVIKVVVRSEDSFNCNGSPTFSYYLSCVSAPFAYDTSQNLVYWLKFPNFSIDSGPNGNHPEYFNPTVDSNPSSKVNGYDTLIFDGTNYIDLPELLANTTTGVTAFAVAKVISNFSQYTLGSIFGNFGNNSEGNSHYPFPDNWIYDTFASPFRYSFGAPNGATTSWHIFSTLSSTDNKYIAINGTGYVDHYNVGYGFYDNSTDDPGASFIYGGPFIGLSKHQGAEGGFSYFWRGNLAEVLIYDRELSTSEMNTVHAMLAEKYSILI